MATIIAFPLRKLLRCERGLALTEFAFGLPIFILLLLGGLELSNLALTHMRINQIAMTVADNAGRVRGSIDETQVYEVFSGADLVGRSLDFAANGRIVLSSLEPNRQTGTRQGQWINWQRCHGSLRVNPAYGRQGAGQTNSTLRDGLGPVGNRIVASPETAVMFVEATYQYRPLFFGAFMDDVSEIRYESAFNVRERTNQNITNTQNLPLNSC